jgi:hypothetical protein
MNTRNRKSKAAGTFPGRHEGGAREHIGEVTSGDGLPEYLECRHLEVIDMGVGLPRRARNLMSCLDAARFLHRDLEELADLASERRPTGPGYFLVNGIIFYPLQDLEEWAYERRLNALEEAGQEAMDEARHGAMGASRDN